MNLNQLEPVPCNLCGEDDFDVIANMSRFDLPLQSVICKKCGLMYLNPRMSHEQYSVFYQSAYRSFVKETRSIGEIFTRQVEDGKDIFQFCQPTMKKGQTVLEVGCGPGGILSGLRECGLIPRGVEPSVKESAFARIQGLSVESGMLEDMDGFPEPFDWVIYSRSLNHFAHPLSVLKKGQPLLKEGGHLFLYVLDFPAQCQYGRISQCSQADHLYMFSQSSLNAMLEVAGFEALKMSPGKSPSWVKRLWGKPVFHIRMVAKKSTPKDISRVVLPSHKTTLQEIQRNQRIFRMRALFMFSTYLHLLGSIIRRLGRSIKEFK